MRRRALLSVSDKSGIETLAGRLVEGGWELLSTGGTARAIRDGGLPVTEVAEVTGHPEMMEGRVKTLHPAIHAGLLARRDRTADMQALKEHGYRPIDLVAVNLYPFQSTIARGDVPAGEAMAQVDIGGPTMIRAAAKCHTDVLVVVDHSDYGRVLAALAEGEGRGQPGCAASSPRRCFVTSADTIRPWRRTWRRPRLPTRRSRRRGRDRSGGRRCWFRRARRGVARDLCRSNSRGSSTLRYGENPGQQAAFYTWPGRSGRPCRTGAAARTTPLVQQPARRRRSVALPRPLCVLPQARSLVSSSIRHRAVWRWRIRWRRPTSGPFGPIPSAPSAP